MKLNVPQEKMRDDRPLTAEQLYKKYLERYPNFLNDIAYNRDLSKERQE